MNTLNDISSLYFPPNYAYTQSNILLTEYQQIVEVIDVQPVKYQ